MFGGLLGWLMEEVELAGWCLEVEVAMVCGGPDVACLGCGPGHSLASERPASSGGTCVKAAKGALVTM